VMDEGRVRDSLRQAAAGAPAPSDLRNAVQRRVVNRRRRVIGLSIAAALVIGFSSAIALDAVDDNARIEVVPATTGESSSAIDSTSTTTTIEPVATATSVSEVDPLNGWTQPVFNPTESWLASSVRFPVGCTLPLPASPCDTSGRTHLLVLVPPGMGESIPLPRSAVGEIAWLVVDAPRTRIFFGVSSGCDPGVNGTWMIGFDGGSLRKLSESGNRPAVSADGRFLAFSEHTDGCGSRQLVVLELDSGRQFTYTSTESLGNVAWVDDGAALLVGTETADAQVLRFPISDSGAIADPEPVGELVTYRVLDSSGDATLLARECPVTANCVRPILGYAIARDGVIEREIPCPGGDCDRRGEPRLDPDGGAVMWVSSDAAAWGVDGLGDQEILPHTSDNGFVLLTRSGVADW
jgi:hypothetical protein